MQGRDGLPPRVEGDGRALSCRFLSGEEYVQEDPQHRKLRVLRIAFHNGHVSHVFVTDAPSGSWATGTGREMNCWHYEIKERPDGSRTVSLTAVPSSSVKVLGEHGEEVAHETVTDWPLEPEVAPQR